MPPPEATIQVAIGWRNAPTGRGTYVVDELDHAGSPDLPAIRVRIKLRGSGAAKRSQSYHQATVRVIVPIIATRHVISPVVASDLSGTALPHIDQTQEPDWHFLTRPAERCDAIATVKAGRLLFFKRGSARTAGRIQLPGIVITRRKGDTHRWTLAKRDAYAGVIAEWHDQASGERKEVVPGGSKTATSACAVSMRTSSRPGTAPIASWRASSAAPRSWSTPWPRAGRISRRRPR